VYHLAEIPFVFDEPQWMGCTFTPEQQSFSTIIGNYWTNMVISKNPNQPTKIPTLWGAYNASNQNMYFNSDVRMESNYRSKYCDFWDTVYPYMYQ